jgi:hypothetical protein
MPSQQTIQFQGQSGEIYDFDVFPINTVLGKIGAIYLITRRTGNELSKDHHSVFVGETDSLRDLVKNHPHKPCFDSQKANCICVLNEPNKQARTKIVDDVLAVGGWVCNPSRR